MTPCLIQTCKNYGGTTQQRLNMLKRKEWIIELTTVVSLESIVEMQSVHQFILTTPQLGKWADLSQQACHKYRTVCKDVIRS
jgi:hypothetical protein